VASGKGVNNSLIRQGPGQQCPSTLSASWTSGQHW